MFELCAQFAMGKKKVSSPYSENRYIVKIYLRNKRINLRKHIIKTKRYSQGARSVRYEKDSL